jgi:hypothetical protein
MTYTRHPLIIKVEVDEDPAEAKKEGDDDTKTEVNL